MTAPVSKPVRTPTKPVVKKKLWRVPLMFVAVAFITWAGLNISDWYEGRSVSQKRGPSVVSTMPVVQQPAVRQDPEIYGNFKINTDGIEEIEVPAGYSLEVGTVEAIAFDYYIDGGQKMHCPVGGKDRRKTKSKHMAGFQITPGQGVTQDTLGYVMFLGDKPPPKWWARALSAPSQ